METWFRLATALEVGFDELFTAATGSTTNTVPANTWPGATVVIRAELALGTTSDVPGALHADGTRPHLIVPPPRVIAPGS